MCKLVITPNDNHNHESHKKTNTNRIRKVMPSIIEETQFAFIEGRHLLQSVLITNEIIDEARKNHKPCLIFKIDFEKAYDSVSWEFLLYMLRRFGFSSRWIKWIEGSLKSMSMSVLVNGSPTNELYLKKELDREIR